MRTYKSFLSTLVLGVYLFAALFSTVLHEHGSSSFFKNFEFKKVEKTYSATDQHAELDQCLSCHFAHQAKTYFFDQTAVQWLPIDEIRAAYFSINKKGFQLSFQSLFLRGPPSLA